MYQPVLRSAACLLVHTPHLVRHGSKPSRTLPEPPAPLPAAYVAALRSYEAAVTYAPNQVFVGNLPPEALYDLAAPWWRHPLEGAQAEGQFGPILPEALFLGWLKAADPFDLLLLEEEFAAGVAPQVAAHPLGGDADAARIGRGVPAATLAAKVAAGEALPLTLGERLVGAVLPGHDRDAALAPAVLLENLATKASAALALRRALAPFAPDAPAPTTLTHILSASEEAVGDRYNRGGGNLAKAIGELAGCVNASGCDVKAFCAGPVHALIVAGSLVAAGVAESVAVVGGGCLAKLGMKYESHLAKGLPILEDCLGAVAAVVGRDDGRSPRLCLDIVGRHPIGAGSAQQAILEALVVEPLTRAGRRLIDVDKYATELQNPEITAPAERADVARQNYRLLAALAARRGEIATGELEAFVRAHGLPGYAPTQGHIPSAIPYLPWARTAMLAGRLHSAMFLAKGSLFLGRMTNLADGASLLLEAP